MAIFGFGAWAARGIFHDLTPALAEQAVNSRSDVLSVPIALDPLLVGALAAAQLGILICGVAWRQTLRLRRAVAPTKEPAQDAPLEGNGRCPNCAATIPRSSAECPQCKAVFGPGSAWKIEAP